MKKDLKVKTHSERPDLTGEHPFGDLGQLLLVFIIVSIVDYFFIGLKESTYINLPYWIWIICGAVILAFGFYYARLSLKMIFGTRREKPEIISNKVYNNVRHPMYLGAVLFYCGVTFIMCSLPLAAVTLIIFLFYNFIAKHEEKLLVQKFGDEYIIYMKKVRRWIPRF